MKGKINHYLFITVLGFIIVFSGCKTQKNLFEGADRYESKSPWELGNLTYQHNNNYDDLLLKNFKIKYDSPENNHTLYGTAKILRDSLMLVSLRAPMGMEISRVLLDSDSVKVINRSQKEVVYSDYNYLVNFFGFHINFTMIEDILSGNFPDNYTYSEDSKKDNTELPEGLYTGKYYRKGQPKSLKFEAWVFPDLFRMEYIRFFEERNIKIFDVKYADYESIGENYYPGEITITHGNTKGKETQVRLIFDNFEENTDKEINFDTPSRYEKIKL